MRDAELRQGCGAGVAGAEGLQSWAGVGDDLRPPLFPRKSTKLEKNKPTK